jgi:hypothetical protein
MFPYVSGSEGSKELPVNLVMLPFINSSIFYYFVKSCKRLGSYTLLTLPVGDKMNLSPSKSAL